MEPHEKEQAAINEKNHKWTANKVAVALDSLMKQLSDPYEVLVTDIIPKFMAAHDIKSTAAQRYIKLLSDNQKSPTRILIGKE